MKSQMPDIQNYVVWQKRENNLILKALFNVYDHNTYRIVMEGISLDFHCFKTLNNNLEARLFYMFILMAH